MSDVKSKQANDAQKTIKRLHKTALRVFLKIVIVCVVICLLWCFVGEIHLLHDNNMYPHLKDGSLLITCKIGKPIKNEVVLYEQDGKMRVGRVIATQGDVVTMDESGAFEVNGLRPAEYVFYATYPAVSDVQYPLTVGGDTYFVMNDMRETVTDSRSFGCIPSKNIHGKIVLMLQYRNI